MDAAEAKLQRANDFLTELRTRFDEQDPAEVRLWLAEITKLKNLSTNTRTVVGIVGSTGAGKSALINALLEEERILPTNCMRACTAVVTEISYNTTSVPYRAEIEFVGKDQWRSELEALLDDLFGDDGRMSSEYNNESTEAGLAYSKLKAVYPDLSRDDLACSSIEDLMSHKNAKTLGDVIRIDEFGPLDFYKRLRVYIDSGEKLDFRSRGAKSSPQIPEFWPLIRVVRVYLKSSILGNGLVLVDLPGVQDSNATRAAVTEHYLKECSRLFIVAPITRAVDDKSAKSLMGESFKRQLKLDGTFDNITFICSKVDSINEEEVQQSLDLAETLKPCAEKKDRIQAVTIERDAEYDMLKTKLSDATQKFHEADLELEDLIPLLVRARTGKVVTAPIRNLPSQRKRKRVTSHIPSRKRLDPQDLRSSISSDDDSESEYSEIEEPLDEHPARTRIIEPEEVEQKAAELRQRKSDARSEIERLRKEIKALEHKSKSSKRELTAVCERISKICISARNDYSRAAIKNDFAAGIEELDTQLAVKNDADNVNPEERCRNYEEVANGLPVFCISSLAFQKLQGRLRKERKVWGFESVDDTEVPQLQHHICQIAKSFRTAALSHFMAEVDVLCNSLRIWAADQTKTLRLTEAELAMLKNALKAGLQEFTDALLVVSKEVTTAIASNIADHVGSKFGAAVDRARNDALIIVSRWSRPVDYDIRANGGLHASTYKATTRRNGVWVKKDIIYDFNRDLSEPLVDYLTPGWEVAFARLIPLILKEASQMNAHTVTAFQASISAICLKSGIDAIQLRLLGNQTKACVNTLETALEAVRSMIMEKHKDMNRQFIPMIQKAMASTYATCSAQCGTGMFVRMKSVMEQEVSVSKESMFGACTRNIGDQINELMDTVDEMLQKSVGDVVSRVERGYIQLVSIESQEKLETGKLLRDDILALVDKYEPCPEQENARGEVQAPEIEAKVEVPTAEPPSLHVSASSGNSCGEPATTEANDELPQFPIVAELPLERLEDGSDGKVNENLFP